MDLIQVRVKINRHDKFLTPIDVVDEPSTSSVSNMENGLDKHLPSFWVPSKTPTAEKSKLLKPVR